MQTKPVNSGSPVKKKKTSALLKVFNYGMNADSKAEMCQINLISNNINVTFTYDTFGLMTFQLLTVFENWTGSA